MLNMLHRDDLMVLIDGGGHQLRSFEQPALENGLWYLVSFVEMADTATASEPLFQRRFKQPFAVLLDLSKRLIIYRYGGRKSKPVSFTLEPDGSISTHHLFKEALLTGTYNRQFNCFTLALRYINATDYTVFLEFEKNPPNRETNTSNRK
jgi:hypothetical protein